MKNLAAWIKQEQPNNPELKLCGVVLAPNVNGESTHNSTAGVTAVRGDDAISMLCGLSQIVQYVD